MLGNASRIAMTCLTIPLLATIALGHLTGLRSGREDLFHQIDRALPIEAADIHPSLVDCNADLFYKLVAEHRQSPLTVSPDGTMILLRVLGQDRHFGLAIESTTEKRILYSLHLDGDVLHATWSRNSEQVAFFLQDNIHSMRSLYIWNMHTDTTFIVREALSYAEQRIDWSPDDRYLAYYETLRGVYLVNLDHLSVSKLDIPNVLYFEWDNDNTLLAITQGTNSTTILKVSRDQSVRDTYTIPFRVYVGAGSIRTTDGVLLATMENNSHSTVVVFIDLNRHKELGRRLFNEHLTELRWFDDHDYVAVIARGPYRNVVFCNADTTRCQRLTRGTEVDDIVRVDPSHRNIAYTRRGSSPEELRLLNTKTKASTRLVQAPTGDLPVLSPFSLRLGQSADGRADGYLWCPSSGVTAAIIRLHGRNSSEMPVWQDDIAAANRVGLCYLTIDYEDAASQDSLQRLVRNGSMYLQNTFHMKPRRIVLLGYSAGAEDGLFIGTRVKDGFGLLVLACLSEKSALTIGTDIVSEELSVALIEPRFDRESEDGTLASMAASLKKHGIRGDHLTVKVVNDTHLLVHPQSWIAIYGQIYSFLGIGDCDASHHQ